MSRDCPIRHVEGMTLGWYVVDKTGKRGPFSAEEIRDRVRSGALSLDCYVQREKSFVKRRIGDISLFFREASPLPTSAQATVALQAALAEKDPTVVPKSARKNQDNNELDGNTRIVRTSESPSNLKPVAKQVQASVVRRSQANARTINSVAEDAVSDDSRSVQFSVTIPELPLPVAERSRPERGVPPIDPAVLAMHPATEDRRKDTARRKAQQPQRQQRRHQSSRHKRPQRINANPGRHRPQAPRTLGHVVMQQRLMAAQKSSHRNVLSWETIVFVVLLVAALFAVLIAYRVSNSRQRTVPRQPITSVERPVYHSSSKSSARPESVQKPSSVHQSASVKKVAPASKVTASNKSSVKKSVKQPAKAPPKKRISPPKQQTPKPAPPQKLDVSSVGLIKGWPRPAKSGADLIQSLGQQVSILNVQAVKVPTKCSPCHIVGRMPDGTTLILTSTSAMPWLRAGVRGTANINLMGTATGRNGAQVRIFVKEIVKR